MDNKPSNNLGRNERYLSGYRYGRRDGRYARLFGRMPFVCISAAEARAVAWANAHRIADEADRAYWLGYARGLTA